MFNWKHYVYEVNKEKSFSKAAHNLYISQPSLSARIKAIEEEIGSPIFDRSTSPIRLTEVRAVYIKAAEDIMKIEEEVENYINDFNTLRSGHLSIGASNVFAAYALPSIITEFKSKYPEINVRLIEGNTAALEEMLGNNSIDMVIDNNHYDSALYDKELYVGKAPHGARVRIDEEGCVGAAYTVITAYGTSSTTPPLPEVEFILDRPFIFVVTNEAGIPLFVGVINQL